MGSSASKQSEEVTFRKSSTFRRSFGGRKSSKADEIDKNYLIINNLKAEIDIFEGNRSSARYKEFHEILTTISKKLQLIKSKTGKQQNRDRCDEVLGQIQNCFQRLETRVNFVQQTENSLDLAAVESHSFINHNFQQHLGNQNQAWAQDSPLSQQSPNQLGIDLLQSTEQQELTSNSSRGSNKKPPPPALLNQKWAKELPKANNQKQPKFDSIRSFERLEHETLNLERDIKRCIELEDYKQFKILEKKIEILYTDLEMITVDDFTPLSDRKATIGKRLIKCNNQIKKAKKVLDTKASEYPSNQDGPAFSKPTMSDPDYGRERNDMYVDFNKIESKLEDFEIQALTFEGIKADRRYKELEQMLEDYWTRVYSADAFGTKEKNKKASIIDRIKNILQELRKRADENEKQAEALKKLKTIEKDVQVLKKKCEEFKGTTKDSTYLELDQRLRTLWANIIQIQEPNEHVRRSKGKVINEIQAALKALSQDTKNRDSIIYENSSVLKQVDTTEELAAKKTSPTDEEILQIQLLNQVKEFQNHWNQLNYNLNVQSITKSEISKTITDIFEKVADGMNKKRNALEIVEKRKSTGSLVVAKVIENTDLLKITTVDSGHVQNSSLPDRYRQEGQTSQIPVATSTFVTNNYENHYIPQKIAPVSTRTNYSYNVTPDLLQKQVVTSPASKPMETEIKVQPTVKTIGEMNRVGAEAKVLLQQVTQSNCIKHDAEYNGFLSKLEQCRKALQSIEYNKRSETIESNRRRASKTIGEASRALEEKPTPKPVDQPDRNAAIRSSRAQEVMDIDAEIQYFRQQIKNFTGVTKDKQYEKIKQGLSDCLTKLQIMDDMHMSKQDSIRHIQQYHQELETKLAENQAKVRVTEQNLIAKRQTSQDIRVVIERVQKLKGQVERFSGVYDGLLYKQIQENLRGCSQKLDETDTKSDEKLEGAKLQTQEKIRKYLRVLEDKSTKSSTIDQPFLNGEALDQPKQETVLQNTQQKEEQQQQYLLVTQPTEQVPLSHQRRSQIIDPNSAHYKINALRDRLVEVKNKTETFAGKYKDPQYQDIEVNIINCLEELKLIDDKGHKSVIISKEQYEDYIGKLMTYFEEKSKIQADEKSAIKEEIVITKPKQITKEVESVSYPIQAMQTFKIADPMQELTAMERKIEVLRSKVLSFEGLPGDAAFKDLRQTLAHESVKLENLQAGNVAHVRELKRKLAQELVDCIQMLETKANNRLELGKSPEIQHQIEKIEDILKQVEEKAGEVYAFAGVKNDKEFCYLDEVLIKLMIQLDNIETYNNSFVKDERKKAIQLIQKTMKLLSNRAKSKEDTEVDLTATTV